jgi:hypothetical protein
MSSSLHVGENALSTIDEHKYRPFIVMRDDGTYKQANLLLSDPLSQSILFIPSMFKRMMGKASLVHIHDVDDVAAVDIAVAVAMPDAKIFIECPLDHVEFAARHSNRLNVIRTLNGVHECTKK